LLHYIVEEAMKQFSDTNMLKEYLQTVPPASKIALIEVQAQILLISTSVQACEAELEICPPLGEDKVTDTYRTRLTALLDESTENFRVLKEKYAKLDKAMAELIKWYGENPAQMTVQEFLVSFSVFSATVEQGCKHIITTREQEAKRLEKEAAKAAKEAQKRAEQGDEEADQPDGEQIKKDASSADDEPKESDQEKDNKSDELLEEDDETKDLPSGATTSESEDETEATVTEEVVRRQLEDEVPDYSRDDKGKDELRESSDESTEDTTYQLQTYNPEDGDTSSEE